jgi:hypothetical protein
VTRDEAVAAVQALCQAFDPAAKTRGLNAQNVGGVSMGPETLYFGFEPSAGTLSVMALIYRFRAKPKPAVMEAFRVVEKEEDKGGGKLDFQAPSKSMMLTRAYSAAPALARLKKDAEQLVAAARRWREEIVPKVAARANAGRARNLS